jgi:hypothetical protein
MLILGMRLLNCALPVAASNAVKRHLDFVVFS